MCHADMHPTDNDAALLQKQLGSMENIFMTWDNCRHSIQGLFQRRLRKIPTLLFSKCTLFQQFNHTHCSCKFILYC